MTANGHEIERDLTALNDATEEVIQHDLVQSRAIAEFLKRNPQGGSQENLQTLLAGLPVNPAAEEAKEYLTQQGLIILYRGQAQDTRVAAGGLGIFSPVARSLPPEYPDLLPELTGVERSQRLYEQLTTGTYLSSGGVLLSREELALKCVRMHDSSWMWPMRPPIHTEIAGSLVDPRIGGIGIPTTRLPGIAANSEWIGQGDGGVIYVIRHSQSQAILASGSLLDLEREYIIFNQIPDESIYRLLEREKEYPPALRIDDYSPNIILI